MKTIEKVHIIPLGFERSIVVNPVRALGGVRAHIVTIGGKFASKYEMSEKQRYFERAVVNDLENIGIDVEVHYTDLFDFKMTIGEISKIILTEKEGGSEVYVNISSHGRLVSVASALASWYHCVKAYYVLPDGYARNDREEKQFGRSICGKHPRILEIPPIWMFKLPDEEKHALSFIYSKKSEGVELVGLSEIIKELQRAFPDIYPPSKGRKEKQVTINKINRRVLDKLVSRRYVERVKTGRYTAVKITELGEFMVLLEGGWRTLNDS